MAFGSWSGSNGTRNDDPWMRPDESSRRDTQCRHESEPELVGSELRRKRQKPRLGTIIIILILLMLISMIAVTAFIFNSISIRLVPELPWAEAVPAPENPIEELFKSDAATGTNNLPRADLAPEIELQLLEEDTPALSIQEIYTKCLPSIVGITTYVDGTPYGWATGVIMTEDGYIITNSHVLDVSDEARVTLYNDEEYPAKLVGYDSFSDIAVIKIDCDGLTAAQFGNSDTLRVGDDVVAIGNPLGIEFSGTMTDGIVSAINREVDMDGHLTTLIQTNAQINGGSSGGALIDMKGRVIGITHMKLISYYTSIEGLAFAIPSGTVKAVVDEIMDTGFVAGRPGIGVTVGGITAGTLNGVQSPAGLYVSKVIAGSGADQAGIMVGDIITHANGTAVYTTADLNAEKDHLEVGQELVLTVWREGEVFDTNVEIMDMSSLFN